MKLFTLLFFSLTLLAVPSSNFDEKLDTFAVHFKTFYYNYYGCPMDSVDMTTCKPAKAFLSYHEYDLARSAAAKLFNLQEK